MLHELEVGVVAQIRALPVADLCASMEDGLVALGQRRWKQTPEGHRGRGRAFPDVHDRDTLPAAPAATVPPKPAAADVPPPRISPQEAVASIRQTAKRKSEGERERMIEGWVRLVMEKSGCDEAMARTLIDADYRRFVIHRGEALSPRAKAAAERKKSPKRKKG
jgi:hypothetical protein